jgi:hypothetical protein
MGFSIPANPMATKNKSFPKHYIDEDEEEKDKHPLQVSEESPERDTNFETGARWQSVLPDEAL